jgi:hypothetical protein
MLLGDCLEGRNGIRNTFCFVCFSKFGTYSATHCKIDERGPLNFFILQLA